MADSHVKGGRPGLGRALAAGACAGLALWCTGGSLERVSGAGGTSIVRVALLPSLWRLGLDVLLVTAVAIGLAWAMAWWTRRAHAPTTADADVTLPLFGSLVLVLPYLPYLADWWPVLTALSGPFTLVVWLGIGTLTLWACVERIRSAGRNRPAPTASAVPAGPWLIVVAACLVYGSTAARLTGTQLFPGGDEPHYLVVAQSLWRDGDLAIENNHVRGDTFEYFRQPLAPHYLVRGVDRQIYSIHPVGLSVVAAPIYAAGGYRAVVALIVACATGAGLVLWRLARRRWSAAAATFAWLACAVSAPFVFNSFAIYPEVPAALAAIAVYALLTRPGGLVAHAGLALACGACLAILPWLSSKYALMVAALGLMAASRVWWSAAPASPARRLRVLLLLTAPVVASVAGWMVFHDVIWGSPLPSVVYGLQRPMRWAYFVSGAPGLLFDQEFGVFAAAPVLLLVLPGLAGMVWRGGDNRRVALEVLVVFVSLLVPVGAFHIWWGGTASVGRPVIAALLFLGLPIAWLYHASAAVPAVRAACWLLAAGSIAQVGFLALAQQGLLLVAERDGSSRLLEYWSASWPVSSLAPAFITQTPAVACGFTAVWVAGLGAGWLLLRRRTPQGPGAAGLMAFASGAGSLALISLAVPLLLGRFQTPPPDPVDRAQSELLREFDAQARPVGLLFNPFRIVRPDRIPPLLQFAAGPDPRPDRTPVPLLYNARWSLPAGRYRLEVVAPEPTRRLHGTLSLQVGRAGPPLQAWTLEAIGRWTETIEFPVDARFVGLRASPELEAQRVRVRIFPESIVDASARRRDVEVVQSRSYGDALAFFHDDEASPEPGGFWTKGDASTLVAVTAPGRTVSLRLRAGRSPIALRIKAGGTVHQVALAAGATRELPLGDGDTVTYVAIDTSGGFVPAKVDPTSTDTRVLGCWVEIAG